MHKYPKIENVFKRDNDGTKKLIEGLYANETVEYLKDNEWYFTEKIDGTNIGVVWDGYKVSFQGRTERSNIPNGLLAALSELFSSRESEEIFEQKFEEGNCILFGEGYGAGIQNGGLYRKTPSFILFDVYLPDKDLWLKRDAVEDIAKSFGVDVVPVILQGTIKDAVNFVKTNPKSTIGTANMEGVVGHPYVDVWTRMKERVAVKIKSCDF
ncbi:MAG TPA: hypothetical protein DCW90_05310 [Lachnospiraceae bacterium]|nr:hypothetical protein [Lachnospiraceae bacterium]